MALPPQAAEQPLHSPPPHTPIHRSLNIPSVQPVDRRSPPQVSSHRPVLSYASSTAPAAPLVSQSFPADAAPRENSADCSCASCHLPMNGQFVRALGSVYHLDCFRCQDCNKLVANKFFPVDGIDDKQYPLCETDYFRRLRLLCAKCGTALRASYITALDKKYHVEHFTCSVCPTVFGPSDSYYEHEGNVYCHFHYSTRFAVKCTGCQTAILKQFVEIYRNNADEHWHPECYMISKFWNVKLVPDNGKSHYSTEPTPEAIYTEQEASETPTSLRHKQFAMESKVYRIWTVLSTFEESSAACISEMLRLVSSGYYYEGVDMADRFVVHVETLFASLDELANRFRNRDVREIAHIREARILCRKIVNFLSLLSQMNIGGQGGVSQALLTLVTGLAHYLKILIRIALTGALKLDREHGDPGAMNNVLARLDCLSRDPVSSVVKPSALPLDENQSYPPENPRSYGYRSLVSILGRNYRSGKSVVNNCEGGCGHPIDEECVRVGSRRRWHLWCLTCSKCRRCAEKQPTSYPSPAPPPTRESEQARISIIKSFAVDEERRIYCSYCAPTKSRRVFEYVTRLEQFSYVLCVALYRLYNVFQENGIKEIELEGDNIHSPVAPITPITSKEKESRNNQFGEDALFPHDLSPSFIQSSPSSKDERRHSDNIQRMRSVGLDRKLSTNERVAKRSMVVESPVGRSVQPGGPPTGGLPTGGLPTGALSPAGLSPAGLPAGGPPTPGRSQDGRVEVREVPRRTAQPVQTSPGIPTSPAVPSPYSPNAQRAPIRPPIIRQSSSKQQFDTYENGSSSNLDVSSPAAINKTMTNLRDSEIRPTLARTTTAVRIIDDNEHNYSESFDPSQKLLNPTPAVDSLTLAALPAALATRGPRQRPPEGIDTQQYRGRFMSELSALEFFIVRHVAAYEMASDPAFKDNVNLEELLDIIDARKNTFWGKLFKGGGNLNKKSKDALKSGVFAVPIDILIDRHGVDSMLGAGPTPLRIPTILDDMISALHQMDMSVEGVFRKNGNIRRLNELTEAIDHENQINFQEEHPVQLAALMKKFLRSMPEPLLKFKLHALIVASQRIESTSKRKKFLHLMFCLLPKPNRDTVEVLFVFLKWCASFAHVDEASGSKMDIPNLAITICPAIIWARGGDALADKSILCVDAIRELLEWQDDLWRVPQDLEPIFEDHELFSNPSELTSKVILKRAEETQKRSGGRRVGDLGSPYHNFREQ